MAKKRTVKKRAVKKRPVKKPGAKKRLSGAQQRKRKKQGLTRNKPGRPPGSARKRQLREDITHTLWAMDPEVRIAGSPVPWAKIEAMSEAERTELAKGGELTVRYFGEFPPNTKPELIVPYLLSPQGDLDLNRLKRTLRKRLPQRYRNLSVATLRRYLKEALHDTWNPRTRKRRKRKPRKRRG
jgi:hypothetical protein